MGDRVQIQGFADASRAAFARTGLAAYATAAAAWDAVLVWTLRPGTSRADLYRLVDAADDAAARGDWAAGVP